MDNKLLILILEKLKKGETIGHHPMRIEITNENDDYFDLSQEVYSDAITYLLRSECILRHPDPVNRSCYMLNPAKDCIPLIKRRLEKDNNESIKPKA